MAEVLAKTPEEVVIARRKAAAHLQQDLMLSLGQSQSLPDMLMTAPLAINLLGQIKLLAFSDDASRIRLTEPRGGFSYLKRTSLSSAMIQVVDQSADAFDLAEKNMRAIRMQTNVMFGRNGHVQTILMCLQDPRMAKNNLLSSMSKFEKDMQKCAAWAQDVESRFDGLVQCVGEINLAMAEEMTNAAEEQWHIKSQEAKAERAKETQENVLGVLKTRVEDAQSEFAESREQFQKTSSKGEASALFAAAAIGLGRSITSLINATISIFKDAPKALIQTAMTAGRVGAIGIHHHHGHQVASATTNGRNTASTREGASTGLDPALLCAEQIEIQLRALNDLINDALPAIVEEGGSEILACAVRLETLKKSLGEFRSVHTVNARAVLEEALSITVDILSDNTTSSDEQAKRSSGEWDKRIPRWQQAINSLLIQATKLRSFAASQPGHGFGSSMSSPSAGGSDYDRVLHHRHQTLLIKRSAMNEARTNFEKQIESQLKVQADIMDIARKMKDLVHKKTTMEDTKRVLRNAIDVMVAMQNQVRQLTAFFNALTSIISIVCQEQAETYLRTIEAGIVSQGGSSILAVAHSEQQLRVIRETVITLRGHFGFVVHSADMYQDIATRHINPCIRMAANLPLSAGPAEQEEARRQLTTMTDESSEAIRLLAQREMEAYQRDLESRVLEIEGEMAALGFQPLDEGEDENLKAIEEGVKESGEGIVGEMVMLGGLFEEITDDL